MSAPKPPKAPLLLTRCQGCMRRRCCAMVPFRAGYRWPLCLQCLQRIEGACGVARDELQGQGR